jgi:AraC-like DNA-binding protein
VFRGGSSESAASIRHLIRVVAGYGLELDEGPSSETPIFHARVPVNHAERQWEHAVRALGPSLPLVVAAKRPEDHISPLFFAAMSCRTLGEALQIVVRHWAYATDGCRATLVRRGRIVQLRLDPQGPQSLGARLGTEYLLADLARSGRELSGGEWRPTAVVLGHRPPISLDGWESACGVPTQIDPASPGLIMSTDSLKEPVQRRVSPDAGRFLLELLAWLTPRPSLTTTTSERVVALIGDGLDGSAPPFDDTARRLAMSTRSLRRQLAAEGTSYQRLLDRMRRDAAIREMARDAREIKAIAHGMGFSDPRGFRRAFKRWTGLTPQQFRERGRQAGGHP